MKKPNIEIIKYSDDPSSEIHIVEIDGVPCYKCMDKELAEAYEEMIEALIGATFWMMEKEPDGYEVATAKMISALEKAGVDYENNR